MIVKINFLDLIFGRGRFAKKPNGPTESEEDLLKAAEQYGRTIAEQREAVFLKALDIPDGLVRPVEPDEPFIVDSKERD